MTKGISKIIAAIGILFLFGLNAPMAQAEYPDRPITMIVAYGAGGGTDIAARTLVPFIEKYLGGSIVVLNKPGAGGEIGFTELAKAKPDGYTIGFINTPNLIAIPIQRKARYTLDDFTPIAKIVDDPGAFSVPVASSLKSLKDLVAYAKANPGEVTYGTTGVGSDDHLAALTFSHMAEIKLRHVPFSGAAEVRAATLGGHIMMASMNISESIVDAQDGTLRILGQMSKTRWEGASDIPTFVEQGYSIDMGSQRGIAAPAGLNSVVLDKLREAIGKAVADPEFRKKAKNLNLPLAFLAGEEYSNALYDLKAELENVWQKDPWAKQ